MQQFKKPADIRVGGIGCGAAFNMGSEHLRHMREAGVTLVAVSETDPERLKAEVEVVARAGKRGVCQRRVMLL